MPTSDQAATDHPCTVNSIPLSASSNAHLTESAQRGHQVTALMASLRQCNLFTKLEYDDLAVLAEECQIRSLQKEEILFREGEPSDGFFVVQLGQIGVYLTRPDGHTRVFSVFRRTDGFGEEALAGAARHPASAIALEYSRVIVVQKRCFLELVGRRPQLALDVLATISRQVTRLLHLLQNSYGRPIEARLAEWLLQMSPAAAAGCPAVIELPLAKRIIADQLGVTSATLSRTFARLRKEKVIRVEREKIYVLDSDKLRACAASPV